jgi:hypothetical protein
VTWGSSGEDAELFDDPAAVPVNYDATPLEDLFLMPEPPPSPPPPASGTTSTSTGSTEGGL